MGEETPASVLQPIWLLSRLFPISFAIPGPELAVRFGVSCPLLSVEALCNQSVYTFDELGNRGVLPLYI